MPTTHHVPCVPHVPHVPHAPHVAAMSTCPGRGKIAKFLSPEEMTSRDYYFDSYAHFGIHEVSGPVGQGSPSAVRENLQLKSNKNANIFRHLKKNTSFTTMSSTLKGKKTSKSFTHFSTTRPHIEQLLVPLKKINLTFAESLSDIK